MQKILITGGNGQLGSELKECAKGMAGFELIFTDVAELDITNAAQVKAFCEQHQPNFIVNCAAYTAVDKAEIEKEFALLLNATAVKNLAEAAENVQAYFVHVSTDYVFDGKNFEPYKEDDKVNPQSEYGRTKLRGEEFALAYSKSMVIRTAWLYSTFGNNFVKTMLRLGAEKPSLNVVFDQVGTPTNAADLASCITNIIKKVSSGERKFVSGVYHYSNEGVCSWYDFAREIMEQGKRSCEVFPIESKDYPTPAARPHYSVLNKAKIKATYGVEIPYWKDSLRKCIASLNF
ncbi:MAG: dTDP-4-dehydrorhamnose reductase [Prevotellaceae bacterium]|jgi:dTDP-4-dehydrorhamnose reductase|nr:dTDP-4-dehydrorhamnose reductase [Prevotellaceae bacterium]